MERPDGTEFLRDHPRVSGEHEWKPMQPGQREGSSPRERGALVWLRLPVLLVWIIPA